MEATFVPPGDVRTAVQEQIPPESPQAAQEPRWSPTEQWAKNEQEAPQEPAQSPTEPIDPDPFSGFDPQVRQDVSGLEYLGYLEDQFEFAGHHFVIRTLHPEEEFAAALAIQPYRGTLKEPEAWFTAQVAMALKAVDGVEDFCPPIGPDVNDFARARLRWVSSRWFYPLIDWIMAEKLGPLTLRAHTAMMAVQNLSTGNRSAFSPTFDSLTGLGTLPGSGV